MSLEDDIKQIEHKFPEMKGRLGGYYGCHGQAFWEGYVKEVEYRETEDYQMALAHWEEREILRGEGTRIYKYCTLFKREKGKDYARVEEIPIIPQTAMLE